ncbi:hypothetical protein KSF78_0002183 [Schistosoma japonicum]|nr:hypothetical protein KSF78_0002183 [Schistosoma japonicum]
MLNPFDSFTCYNEILQHQLSFISVEQLLNEYLLKWNNKPLINESFESISIEKQFTEKIQITKITVIAGIQVITTFVRFGFRRLQNMVSRNKLVYCSLFEVTLGDFKAIYFNVLVSTFQRG